MHGSVALLRELQPGPELIMREDQRSAQCITLAIQDLLASANVAAQEISLIAVAHGPGSFTGLRVGIMAAKTLAYAWKCDVIGVDTLRVIARQALGGSIASARVWAILDAQRQQLFSAALANDAECTPSISSQVMSREQWLSQLQPGDVVTGAGLRPLREQLPAGVRVIDEEAWQPRARTVGELGWLQRQRANQPCSWQQLEPHYLRGSAAEENPKYRLPPITPA